MHFKQTIQDLKVHPKGAHTGWNIKSFQPYLLKDSHCQIKAFVVTSQKFKEKIIYSIISIPNKLKHTSYIQNIVSILFNLAK